MRASADYLFVPALLWLGMVLAISFLEAPLKFHAPGVSRAVALSVGRVVFRALNRVETVILGLLLCVGLPSTSGKVSGLLFGLTSTFAVQKLILRPRLDLLALRVIRGTEVPPASESAAGEAHRLYVGLEILKVALLATLAGLTLLRLHP